MQSRLACNMPGETSPTAKNMATTSASEGEGKNPLLSEPMSTNYSVVGVNESKIKENYTTWEATNAPHLFNFKWKPTSNGINYERLGKFGYKQLVNHIEGHHALTTKD